MRHIRQADHFHTLPVTGSNVLGPVGGKSYLTILLHQFINLHSLVRRYECRFKPFDTLVM